MEPEQPELAIPEPEPIQATRKILGRISEMVDEGKVESISAYVQMRDGSYMNFQSCSVSRHEDAGRILELAMIRLGFTQSAPQDDED